MPRSFAQGMNSVRGNLSALTEASRQVATLAQTPRLGRTYGEILKSTALIGGSSFVSVVFGILRAKAIAILLGPAGMGLFGLYGALADIFQTVGGLGVQSSGVRQIAEASGVSDDMDRIAPTVTVVRRLSFLLALFGTVVLVVLSPFVSIITFGDSHAAAGISLLGVAVGLRIVAAGQGAVIQGRRRISDLARLAVLASFYSAVISVPLVYWLHEDGVVPSLVGMAVVTALTSWWYSRKAGIRSVRIPALRFKQETVALLKLGLAFMLIGLLSFGSAYLIRLIVLDHSGLIAAGHYQAAWTLGGMYAGFILQAMGADFFPRLTAVAGTNSECNRLVNEQSEISILMAVPGVLGTLTLAPTVMAVFYSTAFLPAETMLRWICLGMVLRIISWPLGFIIMAKGAQLTLLWTEAAAAGVHVALALLLVRFIGPNGAGAAFFGTLRMAHPAGLRGRASPDRLPLVSSKQTARQRLPANDRDCLLRFLSLASLGSDDMGRALHGRRRRLFLKTTPEPER